jgi:hypothetical protein
MDPRLRGDDSEGADACERVNCQQTIHSFQRIVMTTKSLPIGARSRRFVLELPLENPDGFGGVIRSFAPGPQVWGMMGANRLTAGPRRFAIRAASDPDGSRRNLVCLVEEMKP